MKIFKRPSTSSVAVMVFILFGLFALPGCKGLFNGDDPDVPGEDGDLEIVSEGGATHDPASIEFVKNYYLAFNNRDVDAVCGMRLGCNETDKDSVRNNFGVKLTKINVKSNDGARAAFTASGVETHLDGGKTSWTEDLYLRKQDDGAWKIEGVGDFTPGPLDGPDPDLDPERAVRDYYQAINDKDVQAFCDLRIDCDKKFKHSLMRHEGVSLEKVEVKSVSADSANVYVESTESFSDGTKAHWKQDWYLKKVGGRWKIGDTANVELAEAGPSGETAEKGPADLMRDYYVALKNKNVRAACSMRVECNENNKRNIRNHKPIKLLEATTKESGGKRATVYTESIEINDDGSRWRWKQDWFLKLSDNRWLIVKTDNAVFQKE